jgi:hypothetical protein
MQRFFAEGPALAQNARLAVWEIAASNVQWAAFWWVYGDADYPVSTIRVKYFRTPRVPQGGPYQHGHTPSV